MEFYGKTSHEMYAGIVSAAISMGELRYPRGQATRDLGFISFVLEDPHNALPLGTRPHLSTKIAAIEAIQLVAGVSYAEITNAVAPQLAKFMEPEGYFYGAYGTRIRNQVGHVIRKLKNDTDSRQAVITLWDPRSDNVNGMRDYPCTIALQFEIRKFMLCMNVVMRSSDIWLGMPYDWFQFTQLQFTVAHALGLPAGWFRFSTMSAHIYERNVEAAEEVNVLNASDAFQPVGFGLDDDSWVVRKQRAHHIYLGHTHLIPEITHSEQWFIDRMTVTS
jgi:thymidylate synthase